MPAKDFFKGLELLRPHIDEDDQGFNAEHDCIYVMTSFSKKKDTPEDLQTSLDALSGWHWSSDGDCWAYYT